MVAMLSFISIKPQFEPNELTHSLMHSFSENHRGKILSHNPKSMLTSKREKERLEFIHTPYILS